MYSAEAFALRKIAREATTMEAVQDRRTMRRFDMRLPTFVNFGGNSEITETANVSARGVFFLFDKEVRQGSQVELTLTFPPEITLTDELKVR